MLREKILFNDNNNLNIREFRRQFFEMPWHCHSEYELVYIISGSGKKFVGESMQDFEDQDLTFIGPNVPHFFLAADQFYTNNNAFCHWWVIQFSENIFPAPFENMEAFHSISDLLNLSLHGINFSNQKTRKHTIDTIDNMENTSSLTQITALYQLLDDISKDKSMKLLCKEINTENRMNDDIVNKIYTYLLNNFRKRITLDDIAEIVHMRVTTLCSYYKRHTLKSIIETLNEIRLNHACKLLVNTRLDINQIAYESGFRNIANFNRQFLKLKKISPKHYRKIYKQITS